MVYRLLFFLEACLSNFALGQKLLVASYLDFSSKDPDSKDVLLSDLDLSGVTHLIYGTIGISATGDVDFRDKNAAIEQLEDEANLYCHCCIKGGVGALANVKREHQDLRTMVSLADAIQLDTHTTLAGLIGTATGRVDVARNLVNFAREYAFDGVDVGIMKPMPDKIPELLQELRTQIVRANLTDFSLSWAVQHDPDLDLNLYEWAKGFSAVDFVRFKWSLDGAAVGKIIRNPSAARPIDGDNSGLPTKFRSLQTSFAHFHAATNLPKSKTVVTVDLNGLLYTNVQSTPRLFDAVDAAPTAQTYHASVQAARLENSSQWSTVLNTFFYSENQDRLVAVNSRTNIQEILDVEKQLGLNGIHVDHLYADIPRHAGWYDSRQLFATESALPFIRKNLSGVAAQPREGKKRGCIEGSQFCNLRCNSCFEYSVARTCIENKDMALTFDSGPSYLTPTLLRKFSDVNAIATFFVGSDSLKDPVNAFTAKKASDTFNTIGLALEPKANLRNLNEENLRIAIETAKLTFASSVNGQTPSIVRLDVDENDPLDDRICRAINDAGLRMVSFNLDSMDYLYHNQQALFHMIPRRLELGIENSTQPDKMWPTTARRNTTFIARQNDAYQATIDVFGDIHRGIVEKDKYNLKDMATCLGLPRQGNVKLPSEEVCDADKVILNCKMDNSIHLAFQGGPTRNVSPQILAFLKDQPNVRVSMFFDAGHSLLADNWNPEILKQVFDDGHDVGHLLPNVTSGFLDEDNSVTRHLFWRDMQMRDLHFQEVLGYRPRRVMFQSMADYKPHVCAALQDLGYEVVVPNMDSEFFNNETFVPKLKNRFLKYSKWSWTQGSFIVAQREPSIAGKSIDHAFSYLFSLLKETGIQAVSSNQCKTGDAARLLAQRTPEDGYNEPIHQCGDGVCFKFKENCSNCPQDCGSCGNPTTPEAAKPRDPFDAAPQEGGPEKPGISPYADELDPAAVIILAVVGCIVVLILTIFAIRALFTQRTRALTFRQSTSTGNLRELE